MIYIEFTETAGGVPVSHAVELPSSTLAEAAQLLLAFGAGVKLASNTEVEMTSMSTGKKRGVTYARWRGL